MYRNCSVDPNESKCERSKRCFLYCFGEFVTLGARLFIAAIFWRSGMLKFGYYLNGDFASIVGIFRNDYGLPIPTFMAYLSMMTELVGAALLALGLLGRFAALALLIMTALVEFFYIHNVDHIYWGIILAWLFAYGSGHIALDMLCCKGREKCPVLKEEPKKTKAKSKGKKKKS